MSLVFKVTVNIHMVQDTMTRDRLIGVFLTTNNCTLFCS